ncbi:MAG: GAF domain-containing protein, partial [Pseudolabrys sp.]|nr:GAF domain-containing protein [Pseudolabrys sp.]
IANELAARFYAARGFPTIANAYLREARSCYLLWGADGKVRQLETLYHFLRAPESALSAAATIAAPVEHLDFATIAKMSQAMSGEIVLERLIDTLMRLAIEHAGAERALLLLSREDKLHQEAEALTSEDGIVVRQRDQRALAIPDSVVQYVMRTREIIMLDDASAAPAFSTDPYVRERKARSMLCLPLLQGAKLTGVLYLENNLASHVFTPNRIVVLKLLALQAAISFENIYLYDDLAEREAKLRTVQAELAHVSRVTTLGQLTASIAHEVNQPIAAVLINASTAQRRLAREPSDVEGARRALDRIVRDGERAADIVARTRAMVKKAPAQKGDLKINEAIAEVLGLAGGEISKNGVDLQIRLADGLPVIEGDRVQLQQVMLNLIMNAVEAMGQMKDDSRELLVSTEVAADCVLVAVKDSGPGLSEAAVEQVFEAFYTTKSTGLGMGLSICRSIIEAHGGRLWASANMPRGAAFQFTIPVPAEREDKA